MITTTFFTQKHLGGFAVPAVITTPTNAAKEVSVIFDRNNAESRMGGLSVENANPTAQVRTSEIASLTLTNKENGSGDTTLDIDDLWIGDDDRPVTNENDEPVYAAAQYQYTVRSKFRDSEGITHLELTEQ